MQASSAVPFCGSAAEVDALRQAPALAAGAVAAPLTWIDPRGWGGSQQSVEQRLSPREWARMFRILGIPEDSTKDQVRMATTRLRRKYQDDGEALERVEAANLWIMSRMVTRSEEITRQRQQANRMRELGDSPRRLFHKYIAAYLPPGVRQMIEMPNTKHFRWASGLLGTFALLGLCVPTQATNFVGLGAASALGLIYQRNRPEPVKDDMGNVGEVKKINPKEMAASLGAVAFGVLTGALISFAIGYFIDVPMQLLFCTTTCLIMWVLALFLKVYQCFDA